MDSDALKTHPSHPHSLLLALVLTEWALETGGCGNWSGAGHKYYDSWIHMMALALGCSHRVSSRVSTYVDFGCLDFYFCFSFLVISAQILFLVGFYYFCVFLFVLH